MIDKKDYCTIYVVRHGETEGNIKQILQGNSDTPLTKKGRQQARALGERFRNIHFAAFFSSDLLRAKRTAKIIALEKKITVKTTKLLRERRFGKYEAMPWKNYGEELRHMFNRFEQLADAEKFKFKFSRETESDLELSSRALTFLREIAVAYPAKTVLMVSHGGTMRSLLLRFGVFTYKDRMRIKNLAYIKLLSDGVDFFVQSTDGIEKRV